MSEPGIADALTEPQPAAPGLDELEEIVERGLGTFLKVGRALLEIQTRQLYLEAGFRSFASYVSRRWEISPTHAYRQIDAAKVVEIISPTGEKPLPTNEAQARELVPLVHDPDAVRSVWSDTLTATRNHPTARAIRERVAARTGLMPTTRAQRPGVRGDLTCPACGHHWKAT